ncbi:MAG TPA: hypothetical protein VFL10_14655 [Ornithinibacter sp.]|nr:hypothetical protein [Ornithinibacter sp.]
MTAATGGAPPTFVARGPLVGVTFTLAGTLVSAAMTLLNRGTDGRMPGGWVAVTLTLAGATVATWWWARRPQVVVGALGVWLGRTLQRPCEVYLWPDVAEVVHGIARTEGPRQSYLGVRTHLPAPGAVSPDVQAALDGATSLDALLPGTGSFVAGIVRDGQRLRVRTVRGSAVRPDDRLRQAVASVAPAVPVDSPQWPDTGLGRVVTRSIWSVLRRRR